MYVEDGIPHLAVGPLPVVWYVDFNDGSEIAYHAS